MWLMDCIWRRCLFLEDEVDLPLTKPPEMVLIVSCRGGSVGVTSVRAGLGVANSGLAWTFVVARTRRMIEL